MIETDDDQTSEHGIPAHWVKQGTPKEFLTDKPAESAASEDKPASTAKSAKKKNRPAAPAKSATKRAKPGRPTTMEDEEHVQINFLIPKRLQRKFRQHCWDNDTTITAALRQYIVDSVGDKKGPKNRG